MNEGGSEVLLLAQDRLRKQDCQILLAGGVDINSEN